MLIGAMNHPARPVVEEIEWIARIGLDFVDLTIEPPAAAVWAIDPNEIHDALARHQLGAVGHTAYYLPLASPFESLRRAAVEELKRCLEAFAKIGVRWMNLHPDGRAPMHPNNFHVDKNLQSLRELLPVANDYGVGLMVENLPGKFNSVEQLAQILDPLPEIGLHIDIGHCNLMVEEKTAEKLLAAYASRLKHVHLHDNKGGSADLHLPLGAGTIDIAHYIHSLKQSGYNGTVTLEVFCDDDTYLKHSRDLLRKMWDTA